MGLTKAMMKERALNRLKEFILKYGSTVDDGPSYCLNDLCSSLPEETRHITHCWNKTPVCAQDICVFSAVIFDDFSIVFCDYDTDENKISNTDHVKAADELTAAYIDKALIDMEAAQGVESSVPVRKKPEKINHYKKYNR